MTKNQFQRKNLYILLIAAVIIGGNLLFVIRLSGLSYGAYTWQNYAASYGELGHITGTVTADVSTAPLANIRVRAYRFNGDSWNYIRYEDTDALGLYDMSGLSPGLYRIGFFDEATNTYATEYYDNALVLDRGTDIELSAGETVSGKDAALSISGHITGTVTDERDGTPLALISVYAYLWDGTTLSYAGSQDGTDSNGQYDLSGLGPGDYIVWFWDWDYNFIQEKYNNVADFDAATQVTVVAGTTTQNIDAMLAPAAHTIGSITIVKETNPAGGAGFDFTGDLGSFTLDHGQSKASNQLAEGDYVVSESDETGWDLDRVACDSGNFSENANGVKFHLAAGDEITCTFVNHRLSVTADAGGPYAGNEGAPIGLDASGSTNVDMISLYKWDCMDDGSIDETSSSPTGSACTYDDNGVYTVKLKTVDIFDQTSTDTATVNVVVGPTYLPVVLRP